VAGASVTLARTVLSFYEGEQKLRASVGGTPDAEMAELLASVEISQKDDHASLTAKVPVNLLRRVLTP